MQFACQVSELMNALSIAAHALSPRSTLQILEGVLLECEEGEVCAVCSDGSLTIATRFACDVAEPGSVVLPGRLFMDVARKLPQGEMSVTVNAQNTATLKCLGSRTNIAGKSGDLFPQLPQIDARNLIELPQPLLRDMIQQTSFSVSSDENRKILTGCLLEVAGGEARMVALDGFRMAMRTSPVSPDLPTMQAVLPAKLLTELSKISTGGDEDKIALSFGANQMTAAMRDTQVYSTLLEGEYIKYRQILPTGWKTRVRVLDREQFGLCVERASLMARESRTNLIKLEIQGDLMIITSNSELGDVYEEVQTENEGDPLTIAFNVRYLSDILRVVEDKELFMMFNSNVSPCLITPVEGCAFTYMVLPVRVNA